MVDMHSHILFGVDDGPKFINESLELIKSEITQGVSHIILTPHFNKRNDESEMDVVIDNFESLKESVATEHLNVELFLGNEVYLDSNYYNTIFNESFNTLAGSDYVLIEFSLEDYPENIPEICYELKLKGYIPIIAHVERYEIFYDNYQLIKEILNEGAHLQVNASSICNRNNKEIQKFINYLLKNELVSFVASDAHNLQSRTSLMNEAYYAVKKLCSDSYREKIFKLNQYNIILNKYFDSPNLENTKRRYLSKLFK